MCTPTIGTTAPRPGLVVMPAKVRRHKWAAVRRESSPRNRVTGRALSSALDRHICDALAGATVDDWVARQRGSIVERAFRVGSGLLVWSA